MIGFAFFMFEGIPCLLPVMREVENPHLLPTITILAICSLCVMYMTFSSICYYAWGTTLDEPVVTEMLPPGNPFVETMKLLYCLNLIISYPLTIVPTFNMLEVYVLGKKETNREEDVTGGPSPTQTINSEGDGPEADADD